MNSWAKLLRLWPWLAAILTGAAYRACFAPFNQAWICWIALIPLLCALWFSGAQARRRWLRDLSLGYLAGLVFFWGVFYWLYTVTVLGLVLIGFYMALYLAAWSWLAGRLRPGMRAVAVKPLTGLDAVSARLAEKRRAAQGLTPAPNETTTVQPSSPWLSSTGNLRLAFLLAAAWVSVETVRGFLFTGWGWNTLGSALHGQWAMIQIVDLTGVPGLSFLVAFTNVILVVTVARFIAENAAKKMRPHFDFTLTMAAIVGVMAYGVRAVQSRPPTQPLRVSAVQSNVPREQKFNPDFEQATFDKFERLSQIGLRSKPDLLIWPESSMPGPVLPGELSYQFVMEFAAEAKTDLLLGVIDEDQKDEYNAAMLVNAGATELQVYRKVHLVPFGEYVPGRNTIPGIGAIVGDQVPADFGFGHEYTVFRLTKQNVRVAPLICFEDTIGDLTRQFVLRGANVLANVTNDGWFLQTAGSQEHLANAVFRCVETRLPMVRAANTGVTCLVNQFGSVTQTLLDENGSQFTEGVLSGEIDVPTEYTPTFYVRHGEVFAQGCAVVTLLTLLALLPRLVRRKQTSAPAPAL